MLKTVKKFMLILIGAFAVIFISLSSNSGCASASEKLEGRLESDAQCKIGKYYYKQSLDIGLQIAATAHSKAKTILPMIQNGKEYNVDAYFYGKYIYYSYNDQTDDREELRYNYIYRMNKDGSHRKKIAKIKRKNLGGGISLICGNYLYYSFTEGVEDSVMCKIKINTGKVTYCKEVCMSLIQKDDSGKFVKYEHYRYYYPVSDISGGEFWYGNSWILNARTGKFKKIGSKIWDVALCGKKVYYIESNASNTKMRLVSCSFKGTNKRILTSVKSGNGETATGALICKVTSKYCIYSDASYETYYKYVFSSGKTKIVVYKE